MGHHHSAFYIPEINPTPSFGIRLSFCCIRSWRLSGLIKEELNKLGPILKSNMYKEGYFYTMLLSFEKTEIFFRQYSMSTSEVLSSTSFRLYITLAGIIISILQKKNQQSSTIMHSKVYLTFSEDYEDYLCSSQQLCRWIFYRWGNFFRWEN